MKFLISILVLYSIAFSFLAIRNNDLYQTFGWDLGFFDQLLWQASRGNLNFVSTVGDINLVGDHFQPILYLLSPLYWLWDDVRVILIAQTILVASAAIPIYLLAKKKLESQGIEHDLSFRAKSRNLGAKRRLVSLRWIPRLSVLARDDEEKKNNILPLLITIGYLFFHGTQFTLTNEFHQSAFIPLFLSWGLYFLETGDGVTLESPVNRRGAIGSRWILSLRPPLARLRSRMTLGIISLLLLLLVREETALLITGIGLMYLVRRRVKLGIGLVIVGIASFFFLVSLVIPKVSSQGRYIHYGYGELGTTPTEVLSNSIKDPIHTTQLLVSPKEKLIQVRNSLLAFGGLPLLSPTSLIPVVIHYAVRFIDTRNVHRWLDINHYAAPLGPLLAFATIQALSNVRRVTNNVRRATSYVLPMLGIGIIGTNLLVHAPIFALTKSQLYFTPQWVNDTNELVAAVPKDAAIAANNTLVPHLSHRDKIYLLPDIRDADYIAVDLSDGPNKYAPWGYERMREYVDELMGNGEWEIEKKFGKSLLMRRK